MRTPTRPAAFLLTLALCVTFATAAPAQTAPAAPASPGGPGAGSVLRQERPDALDWKFPRFRASQYGATAGLLTGMLAIDVLGLKSSDVRWSGGVLLDDFVRDELRAGSQAGRDRADQASDVLLWSLMAAPMLDAGLTAGVAHGNGDVAWQMAMINAQSFAVTGLTQKVTKRVFGRARPYTEECAKDPDAKHCGSSSSNQGFISGHSAMAFTAAGLMCAHHENLPLYGGGFADRAACGVALGAATATGLLRISADKHYATDVLAGAAVGLASGYLLPKWLHYGFGDDDDEGVPDTYVAPAAGEFTGFTMGGRF